ncbi:HNH endonuclease [Bradyrhizobium sp. 179]|uniref:NUMOD4 domain-containing protein n=1 Tax=Bradyrhizobium sp. 179 TaxID=2782648 RepID=UPI001FFA2A28|nr:HNH endonuclease [Bradyrhizobium sp. 179]
MTERWLPIPGFVGIYEVSDLGRVRAVERIDGGGRKRGGILKPYLSKKGYHRVGLRDRKHYSVHQLVLRAFRGPPGPNEEGCHDNGIRTDNRLDNLYWGTPTQNNRDRKRHGTMPVGETHPQAKVDEDTVRKIKARLKTEPRSVDVALEFGTTKWIIDAIRSGRTWRHV